MAHKWMTTVIRHGYLWVKFVLFIQTLMVYYHELMRNVNTFKTCNSVKPTLYVHFGLVFQIKRIGTTCILLKKPKKKTIILFKLNH